MKVSIVPAEHLPADLVSVWSKLQRSNAALDSPFLRPEYTQLVASVRPGVEVAVLEEGDEPVGFFAYQRERRGIAYPVGHPMCDFQAIIAAESTPVDVEDLMRQCRLRAWHFDHLLVSQHVFHPYLCVTAPSPYLDLSGGFEKYVKDRGGSQTIKDTMRKGRKAGREVGPVRFEAHTTSAGTLETLIRWKTEFYRRTKVANYLAPAWRIALLERLLTLEGDAFSGRLSTLCFGDHLVSILLSLWSGGVLHNWFPSYDTEFHRYSPGLVHQIELAKRAEALGIRRYDLGKGDERYKFSLMTGATTVAEGSVDLRPVTKIARRQWLRTRDWVRASSMKGPARFLVRNVRSMIQRARDRAGRIASAQR